MWTSPRATAKPGLLVDSKKVLSYSYYRSKRTHQENKRTHPPTESVSPRVRLFHRGEGGYDYSKGGLVYSDMKRSAFSRKKDRKKVTALAPRVNFVAVV